MDYLEQRRKLRQMVQERLDYGRDIRMKKWRIRSMKY